MSSGAEAFFLVVPETIIRFWRENLFRAEGAAVELYIRNAPPGRIFSTGMDPVVRLRGKLDFEPINPEQVRSDLSSLSE